MNYYGKRIIGWVFKRDPEARVAKEAIKRTIYLDRPDDLGTFNAAMSELEKKGYICYDSEVCYLTDKGRKKLEELIENGNY
jgi:hypothetical protein